MHILKCISYNFIIHQLTKYTYSTYIYVVKILEKAFLPQLFQCMMIIILTSDHYLLNVFDNEHHDKNS